jgi:hypothetical protein
MDRVHGLRLTGLLGSLNYSRWFSDLWPRLNRAEGVFRLWSQPSILVWTTKPLLPRFDGTGETEHWRCHGCRRWRGSTSSYRALTNTMISPTWPRRARALVLLTFGEANSPRRLAAVTWSPWLSMALHDLAWASLASRSSSKASPWSRQASPLFNWFGRWWIEFTRQLSSSARVWGLWDKIRRARAAIYRVSCTGS